METDRQKRTLPSVLGIAFIIVPTLAACAYNGVGLSIGSNHEPRPYRKSDPIADKIIETGAADHATGAAIAIDTSSPTLRKELGRIAERSGLVLYDKDSDLIMQARYTYGGVGMKNLGQVHVSLNVLNRDGRDVVVHREFSRTGLTLPMGGQPLKTALTIHLQEMVGQNKSLLERDLRSVAVR